MPESIAPGPVDIAVIGFPDDGPDAAAVTAAPATQCA